MPKIEHQAFQKYLTSLKSGKPHPVYLIHGEEFLCRSTLKQLTEALLPNSDKELSYEEIDGSDDYLSQLIETVNTFSFFSTRKLIVLQSAKVFYTGSDNLKFLEKAKLLYDKNELKKAARQMANYLSVTAMDFDDLQKGQSKVKEIPEKGINRQFLDDLYHYAVENGIKVPTSRDEAKFIQACVEKGLPKTNLLIITTDLVDRRKSLYKCIEKQGMIVDCSIPKGNRMADRKAQDAIARNLVNQILSEAGKIIEPKALQQVIEQTGVDLSILAGNLKKLVDYCGKQPQITCNHVQATLRRTREDPIYALTGAVADRNARHALSVLSSLLAANIYPLQVLAAIANQMRKLAVLKDFIDSPFGKPWNRGLSFPQFKSMVMPQVVAYDKTLIQYSEQMQEIVEKPSETGKKKKKIAGTDMVIAKNPNNAYPVFQSLLRADRFTKGEIAKAMHAVSDTDLRLKSTPLNPKIVLEELLIRICDKGV